MTRLPPAPSAALSPQASPAAPPQSLSNVQALSPGQALSQAGGALSRSAQAGDPAKLAKSARDFEAMAIGQLLQPMFDTVDTAHNAFGGGAGEEAWKPMLVQEFAKQIEAHGGLGLAKPIYDAMLRMQGTKSK